MKYVLVSLLALFPSVMYGQFFFFNYEINDEAVRHEIDSVVVYVRTSKEDTNKVLLYNNLSGYILNPDRQIKYSTEMLVLAQRLNYKWGTALAYNYLGVSQFQKKHTRTALKNFYLARELFEELGNKRYVAITLHNIGEAYLYKRKYTAALAAFEKELEIFGGSGSSVSYIHYWIGRAYAGKKDYDNAKQHYWTALGRDLKDCSRDYRTIIHLGIAFVHIKLKEYQLAEDNVEDARELALKATSQGFLYPYYREAIEVANKYLKNIKNTSSAIALSGPDC